MNDTPAPGYRLSAVGTLCDIGLRGYSWSSAVNGSTACFLNFSDNGVGPKGNYNRGYAFQVRCLQE